MKAARTAWTVFSVGVGVAAAAMAGVSVSILALEKSENLARAEIQRRDEIRRVLWRLDSSTAPALAREVARSPLELRRDGTPGVESGFLPRDSGSFQPAPSWVRAHFRILPGDFVRSPREDGMEVVPKGDEVPMVRAGLAEAEARLRTVLGEGTGAGGGEAAVGDMSEWVNAPTQALTSNTDPGRDDYVSRGQNVQQARGGEVRPMNDGSRLLATPSLDGAPGPLLPFWLGDPAAGRLVFARRVRWTEDPVPFNGRKDRYEEIHGFVVRWPELRESLLAEARTVLPGVALTPVPAEASATDLTGRLLATVPVRVDPPPVRPTPLPWSPARTVLVVAWGCVAGAGVAGALAVRAGLSLAERRSRFASAVTHELRTPLTTFRLYTEMLSRDMVPDPEKRRLYLRTLEEESVRLAALVENVLAYARIEEGRAASRAAETGAAALLAGVLPALTRRAQAAGAILDAGVEGDGAAPVTVDVELVGQVLQNLVDNACKYGWRAGDPPLELRLCTEGGRLRAVLRDHGPGIAPSRRRTVFHPFDRGGRDGTDGTSGVGLGLALCQGIARSLGGELRLEHPEGGGARFVMELPGTT